MNHFVIVVGESWDQFDVTVPHPVVTRHSREELLARIEEYLRELATAKEEFARQQQAGLNPTWKLPSSLEPLLDIACSFSWHELGTFDHKQARAEILTVDEWFAKYQNRRFNYEPKPL